MCCICAVSARHALLMQHTPCTGPGPPSVRRVRPTRLRASRAVPVLHLLAVVYSCSIPPDTYLRSSVVVYTQDVLRM
jgi:hypothetical protein